MASDHTRPKEMLKGSKRASRGHCWLDLTSRTWWATDVVPPAASLAGKQAGRTEQRVVTADGFVAVGCSEPPSDFALALAVLTRSRLAPEVTGQSKLDGMARMEAIAKISA